MKRHELMDRLRQIRPTDPVDWAESVEGRRVLDDTLATAREPRRRPLPRPRRNLALAACALTLVAAAGALLLIDRSGAPLQNPPDTARTATIAGSYAYDVNDLSALMQHADQVFVATVVAVTSNDEEDATRTYRVSVTLSVQGSTTGETQVRQRGYVDGDGTVYVSQDQPMLKTGRTYLIAAGSQPTSGPLFVQPGPHAVIEITSTGQADQLAQRYRTAAKG